MAALEAAFHGSVADVPGAVQGTTFDAYKSVYGFATQYTEACIVLGVAFGVLLAYNGRAMIRPSLFFIGALPTGLLLYTSLMTLLDGYKFALPISAAGFVIGGVLIGWLLMQLFFDFGVFLVGIGFGAFLAAIFQVLFLYRVAPLHPNMAFYFAAAFLGAVFGLLTLSYRDILVPVSTAMLGSYVTVRGIAYFIGHFPDPIDFDRSELKVWKIVYVVVILVLGIIGSLSQFGLFLEGGSGRAEEEEEEKRRLLAHKQRQREKYDEDVEQGTGTFSSSRGQKPDQLRGKYAATEGTDESPSKEEKDK